MKHRQSRSPRRAEPESVINVTPGVVSAPTRAWWWLLVWIVVVMAFRPIAADDLWWELSRGREVVRGTMTPSRQLLALDEAAEADWLGGVPSFLAYAWSGSSGLMLLRIMGVVAFTCGLIVLARGLHPAIISLLVWAGLVGAESAFDVGSSLFDGMGIVVVSLLAKRLKGVITWRAMLPLVIVFIAWANLGPRVIVGWLVLVSSGLMSIGTTNRLPMRSWIMLLGLALGAICFTPRGVLTIRDSLCLVFPQFVAEHWMLEASPWQPLWLTTWGTREAALLTISAVTLLALSLSSSARQLGFIVAIGSALLLPWFSAENLAASHIWLVFLLIGLLRQEQPAFSLTPNTTSWRSSIMGRAIFGTTGIACTWLIAIVVPLSLLPGMGWGLQGKLDNRLLQLALSSVQPHGTAFATDVLSAGMVCWLGSASLHAQDVPQRALLGGRLRQQRLIQSDLRSERLTSYWRDDGSEGGWWIPLRQRRTTLLVINANDTSMIRALEPAIWKPLSLDSPVLPYAAAGDPAYNDLLVDVLRQREFVNGGPWTYSPPQSVGSEYDRDRWGFRGAVFDVPTSLRQARVFRAMRLPVAALKIIHGSRIYAGNHHDFDAEFVECQRELAYQELLLASRPSHFRAGVLREALRRLSRSPDADARLFQGVGQPTPDLTAAIDSYVSGKLTDAFATLTLEHPESYYAAACIALESGQVSEAVDLLSRVERDRADQELALLIAARLEELEAAP